MKAITIEDKRKLYPYIVGWGKMMMSFDYYIDRQCERAYELKLPHSVIYIDQDGSYSTYNELKDSTTRDKIARLADEV